MMVLKVLAGMVIGYVVGAAVGWVLVEAMSSNSHDKYAEVVTTALLVTGPIGAITGIGVVGLLKGKKQA